MISNSHKIQFRVMFLVGSMLAVITVLLVFVSARALTDVITRAEQRELHDHFQAFENAVRAESRMAETLSTLVSEPPSPLTIVSVWPACCWAP